MKKKLFQKCFLTMLSILILGTANIKANASTNFKKIPINMEQETIIENYGTKKNNLLTSKVLKILEDLNISTGNLKSSKLIQDNYDNAKRYYLVEFENAAIELDENLNLKSISNFENTDFSNANSKNFNPDEFIKLPIETYDDKLNTKEITPKIEKAFSLTKEYQLVSNRELFDEFWELVWQKNIDGVLNQYDSIKVIVNKKNNTIENISIFKEKLDNTNIEISKEKAIKNSEEIFKQKNLVPENAELQFIKANYFWNENGPYMDSKNATLAWVISDKDNTTQVYIDTFKGDVLGGSTIKADAKSFGTSSVNYYAESVALAKSGFSRLGYSSYSLSNATRKSDIMNFLNSSSAYGFYITCHGSATSITDNKNWRITPSEIGGNWRFVFLDSCSSAAGSSFANAFKIAGYSNRGFLGWGTTVYETPAYSFAKAFWPKVGKMPLQKAAVDAANSVPGAGTTPIRFYGDKSYYGRP